MEQLPLSEYVQKVDEFLEQEAYDEAIVWAQHVLRLFPRYLPAYRLLAQAALEKGMHDDAIDLFRRVLSADPEDFIAYAGLGLIYAERNLLHEAIWHMMRAFELQPNNVYVREQLRNLYEQHTGRRPGRLKMNHAALGRVHLRNQRYELAIQELRIDLEDDPDRVDLRVALAEAYWHAGYRKEAVQQAEQVLNELPNALKANLIVGQFWEEENQSNRAAQYLERARMLDPEGRMAHRLFGANSVIPLQTIVVPLPGAEEEEKEAVSEETTDWFATVGLFDETLEEDIFGGATETATPPEDWRIALRRETDAVLAAWEAEQTAPWDETLESAEEPQDLSFLDEFEASEQTEEEAEVISLDDLGIEYPEEPGDEVVGFEIVDEPPATDEQDLQEAMRDAVARAFEALEPVELPDLSTLPEWLIALRAETEGVVEAWEAALRLAEAEAEAPTPEPIAPEAPAADWRADLRETTEALLAEVPAPAEPTADVEAPPAEAPTLEPVAPETPAADWRAALRETTEALLAEAPAPAEPTADVEAPPVEAPTPEPIAPEAPAADWRAELRETTEALLAEVPAPAEPTADVEAPPAEAPTPTPEPVAPEAPAADWRAELRETTEALLAEAPAPVEPTADVEAPPAEAPTPTPEPVAPEAPAADWRAELRETTEALLTEAPASAEPTADVEAPPAEAPTPEAVAPEAPAEEAETPAVVEEEPGLEDVPPIEEELAEERGHTDWLGDLREPPSAPIEGEEESATPAVEAAEAESMTWAIEGTFSPELMEALHLAQQGKEREALRLFQRIYQEGGQDEALAEALLLWVNTGKTGAQPHQLLGDVYRRLGRLREAADQYREAIRKI